MLWLSSEWARSIEVEMDKGIFVSRAEAESITLKELLERYLDEITPLKKRRGIRDQPSEGTDALAAGPAICHRHSRDGCRPLPGRAFV